jgi:hypothetical protein
MGGCPILIRGEQLLDCNNLSGSNSLTNRILNKDNNNLYIYSYLIKNYQDNNILYMKNNNKIKLKIIDNQVDEKSNHSLTFFA